MGDQHVVPIQVRHYAIIRIYFPEHFCLLPRTPGQCSPDGKNETWRTLYGYNAATDTCIPYKHSGCLSNLNAFESIAQCTSICCNKGFNLQMRQQREER